MLIAGCAAEGGGGSSQPARGPGVLPANAVGVPAQGQTVTLPSQAPAVQPSVQPIKPLPPPPTQPASQPGSNPGSGPADGDNRRPCPIGNPPLHRICPV